MSRLTFLRRIGRPVAILYPVFLAVYLYFADDDTGAAAWGGRNGRPMREVEPNRAAPGPKAFFARAS